MRSTTGSVPEKSRRKADNEEELDRNSPTLTFVRYNRNEYEKEHGAIKEFIR